MRKMLDVPFSSEARDVRTIDVFLPAGKSNGCCIFFIHGGSGEVHIAAGAKHGSFYGVRSSAQKQALTYIEPFLKRTLALE